MHSPELTVLIEHTYKMFDTKSETSQHFRGPAIFCRSYLVVTFFTNFCTDTSFILNPVAARSKAWICDFSLVEIAGSNPAIRMDVSCERCMLSGRDL